MSLQSQIDQFLAGSPHAVVGASRERWKYGNKVLRVSADRAPCVRRESAGRCHRTAGSVSKPGRLTRTGLWHFHHYAPCRHGNHRGTSWPAGHKTCLDAARRRERRGSRDGSSIRDERDRRWTVPAGGLGLPRITCRRLPGSNDSRPFSVREHDGRRSDEGRCIGAPQANSLRKIAVDRIGGLRNGLRTMAACPAVLWNGR